jgi:GLPGLI family protein
MKRKQFLFSLLFITATNICIAQETISLNVVYEFRYVRDLTQKDNPYIYNMVLSLGKGASRYCTEREYKEKNKSIARKKQQQQAQASASSKPVRTVRSVGPGLYVGRSGVIIREEIIKNFPKRTMETTALMANRVYTVETALPSIKWELQPGKKTIDKYTCQKAIGKYAGRVYEVWFAPDLPYQDGPWKLNGLPGLILEARDTTNEVVFTFKGITPNDDAGMKVVTFMKDDFAVKTNLKSYNRTVRAFSSDPEAVMAAARPDSRYVIICQDASGTRQAIKVKKYNPIEKD